MPPPTDASTDFTSLHHRLARQIVEDAKRKGQTAGDHLVASQLAKDFQVSRTPVVRAMELLTQLGVLESKSNRGYFVSDLDASAVFEVQSADEQLYWRIVNDIYDEQLPEVFDEKALMGRYDAPRTRIARLLRRLADEGVVARRDGMGWKRIPALKTPEEIQASLRFRLSIELSALREPGYDAPPEELATLIREQELIVEESGAPGHSVRNFERNARFHETLVRWSHNRFFYDSIVQHNRLRRLSEYRNFVAPRDLQRSTREHLFILQAVAEGDLSAAHDRLKAHLGKRLAEQVSLSGG